MRNNILHSTIFLFLMCVNNILGQDSGVSNNESPSFKKAYELAFEDRTSQANQILDTAIIRKSNTAKIRNLLEKTESWEGKNEEARLVFNSVLSENKMNRDLWVSAVKNELYGENYYLAIGLSNKGLMHIKKDKELQRLRSLALNGVMDMEYDSVGWHNVDSGLKEVVVQNESEKKSPKKIGNDSSTTEVGSIDKLTEANDKPLNTVTFDNSFSVFNEVFEPMGFSSISYKRETEFGSIIPRINYSNRFGINGLQFDLDLYPKIAKGLYAYLNYGYSNSEIYPKHRVGGDVYLNINGGLEFSAGGRFISFTNTNATLITNSVGYYTGNYYFSLRSYISPSSNNPTGISGNLLVRKYLKNAQNYFGVNIGMGFSPELRQLTAENQVLAETLLFLESQRLSFEYQFPSKNDMNTYSTNIGIIREELSFSPGSFFWSFSAGLTYAVKF